MAKKVYESAIIKTMDGMEIEISPIKIKYIHEFMKEFSKVKDAKDDMETIGLLTKCAAIAMNQYCPQFNTVEALEDNFDINAIYKVIELGANIKMHKRGSVEEDDTPQQIQKASNGMTWDDLELDKLEAEVFVLGAWRNYDELERSLSLPELMITVERIRDLDYNEKRFMAAMQGVDLDEQTGRNNKQEEDPWEAMKARVASKISGIGNGDPNDILSFQGQKAAKNGFGIGMGLDYEKI